VTVAVFSENLDHQNLGDGPRRISIFNTWNFLAIFECKIPDFPRPSWGFACRFPLQRSYSVGLSIQSFSGYHLASYNFTQNLILGHPGPVTCVPVSISLSVCVSGIPWDLTFYIQEGIKCRKLTAAVFSENLDYPNLGDGPRRVSIFNFLSILDLLTEHLKFPYPFRI
jgi:hypothetical protein